MYVDIWAQRDTGQSQQVNLRWPAAAFGDGLKFVLK